MALTKAKVREILSEAGVDADHMTTAVGAIMDGHTASIEALREARETAQSEMKLAKDEVTRLTGEIQKANADAEQAAATAKSALEKVKAEAKAALEQANASADTRVQAETEKLTAIQKELDALKAEHETAKNAVSDLTKVKEEYEAYRAEQEAKVTTASKEAAFEGLLKDMNLSDKGIALAMKYTDLNTVELNEKGKISNAAALRKSVNEDWSDYIQQDETKGADTANPPATTPTAGPNAAEILAMTDDGDMYKAIEANPAAFGLA